MLLGIIYHKTQQYWNYVANAWTAIDRFSVIWKSDLTDKPIKWSVLSSKQRPCRYCYIDAPHGCWLNGRRKSLTAITQECCVQYWTSPGDSTPQSSSYTTSYHPSRKLSKLDEPDIQDTAGEVGAPLHGRAKAGRLSRTYIQQFCADTVCSLEDRPEVMDDREGQGYPCWWRDMMIMITIDMRKEWNFKYELSFNFWIIFLIGRMGLVCIDITTINLQICHFQSQITTISVQSDFFFIKSNAHG